MNQDTIIIVSGLPRSGTSMMMKMLEAGGIPILTDNQRTADADNPKGYYEFERVKKLETDQGWLAEARGKAVKVISELLKYLPAGYTYKIIFMHRAMEEILASQKQMLVRRGRPTDTVSDEKMGALLSKHVERVEDWLAQQPNMDVIYVSYNEVMQQPAEQAKRVNAFLDDRLNFDGMLSVVDPALHRQKAQV